MELKFGFDCRQTSYLEFKSHLYGIEIEVTLSNSSDYKV